jgi:hypothetical protein
MPYEVTFATGRRVTVYNRGRGNVIAAAGSFLVDLLEHA